MDKVTIELTNEQRAELGRADVYDGREQDFSAPHKGEEWMAFLGAYNKDSKSLEIDSANHGYLVLAYLSRKFTGLVSRDVDQLKRLVEYAIAEFEDFERESGTN